MPGVGAEDVLVAPPTATAPPNVAATVAPTFASDVTPASMI